MKKAKFLRKILENDEVYFNGYRYFVQPWHFKTGDMVSVCNTQSNWLSVFNMDGTKLICRTRIVGWMPFTLVKSLNAPLNPGVAKVMKI